LEQIEPGKASKPQRINEKTKSSQNKNTKSLIKNCL
jgi:hypothetical protein